MLTNGIFDEDIAARHRRCNHIRSSLDTVWNDRIRCRRKARHTVDLNTVCSCATNVCSHDIEIVRKIHNLRLKCRILEDRLPLSTGCRHHHIFRGTYTRKVKIDACAP